jgi:hypothetical protein
MGSNSPPPIESASAFPAPLSSLVTTGAEYGNLQGDYDETNHENQPKLATFGSMFHEFKSTAARAQSVIGDICADIERYIALFSWRDELVSTVATAALLLLVIVLLVVPINLIAFVLMVSLFHVGYRRSRWRRIAIDVTLKQHVIPLVPDGIKPYQLSGVDAHRVCLAINKKTGLNLTQKLLAKMSTAEEIATWICANSTAFAKYRKWMKRDWIENFIDHIPPEVSTELQVFLADLHVDYVGLASPVARSTASSDESNVEITVEPSLISETL